MLLSRFPDRTAFAALAQNHNVIPVCAEILADTDTPVGLLRKFYPGRGPVFLLESVEGGERWGRYSFLGTAVRRHLRVFDRVVRIEENGRSAEIAHHGDPLAVLSAQMATYRPARLPELPRFWGGLVGYLSYEMVSFFRGHRKPPAGRPAPGPLRDPRGTDHFRQPAPYPAVRGHGFCGGSVPSRGCVCRRRKAPRRPVGNHPPAGTGPFRRARPTGPSGPGARGSGLPGAGLAGQKNTFAPGRSSRR